MLGILIAGSLLAANAAPKDDVIAAAKKLGRTSYSWNSTSTHLERGGPGGPEGGGGPGGPPPGGGAIEGKASQDGVIAVSMALREGAVEVIKQGGKTVFNSGQSWEAAGDPADAGPGPDGFIAMMAQSITAPAAEAQDLAAKAAGLDYHKVGECIALNSSIRAAHGSLMESPAHRENILDPDFRFVGIGVVRQTVGTGRDVQYLVTEDFADEVRKR